MKRGVVRKRVPLRRNGVTSDPASNHLHFRFTTPLDLVERLAPAAWDLWWGWQGLQLTGADPWEFALSIDSLLAAGIRDSELSWLIENQLLYKARAARSGDQMRQRTDKVHGSVRVVLTHSGAIFLERNCLHSIKPNWDRDLRMLSVQGHVIKEFKRPSDKQEWLLDAFQRSGWVREIDDPFAKPSGNNSEDSKRRFRKTVEHLNCAQHPSTLFFSVAGNGKRVRWSFRHAKPTSASKRLVNGNGLQRAE